MQTDNFEQQMTVPQTATENVALTEVPTTPDVNQAELLTRYEEITAQLIEELSSNVVNATILSLQERKSRQFEALGAEYAMNVIDEETVDKRIEEIESNSEFHLVDVVNALGVQALTTVERSQADAGTATLNPTTIENVNTDVAQTTTENGPNYSSEELLLPEVDDRPEQEIFNDLPDLEQEEIDYINDVLLRFDEVTDEVPELDEIAYEDIEEFEFEPTIAQPQLSVDEKGAVHVITTDTFSEPVETVVTKEPQPVEEIEPTIATEPYEIASSAASLIAAELEVAPNVGLKPVTQIAPAAEIAPAATMFDIEPAPALSYELLPSDTVITTVSTTEEMVDEDIDELPEDIFEPEIAPSRNEHALNTEEAYIVVSAFNRLADKISDAGISIKNQKLENKLARKAKLPKTDKNEFVRRQQAVLEKFFTAVEQGDEFTNLELIDENNQSNLMFTFVDYIGDINDQVRARNNWRVVREIVEANIDNPDRLETGAVIAPSISPEPETSGSSTLDHFRKQSQRVLATLESENSIQNGAVSFDTVQTIIDRDDINIVTLAKDLIDKGIITLDTDKRVISLKDALLLLSIAKTPVAHEVTTAFLHSAQAIAQEEITQFHEFRKLLGDDNQLALAA